MWILCFAKSYLEKKCLLNTMYYIGIVHPKMKNLSSFTPNLHEFLSFWAQKKIFWKLLITKKLSVAIDFHTKSIFFKTSCFVFIGRKKLMQVWNKWRVSKWWPFNILLIFFPYFLWSGNIKITFLHVIWVSQENRLWWSTLSVSINIDIYSKFCFISSHHSVNIFIITQAYTVGTTTKDRAFTQLIFCLASPLLR